MHKAVGPYLVEEHTVQGETVWVAIRARGAEWSWLTPAEAAQLGREWVEKYGNAQRKERVTNHNNVTPLLRDRVLAAAE